jgi:hypothetical protein
MYCLLPKNHKVSLSTPLNVVIRLLCIFSLIIIVLKFTICIQVDISTTGVTSFGGPEGKFDVEVFDSANDYVKLMK